MACGVALFPPPGELAALSVGDLPPVDGFSGVALVRAVGAVGVLGLVASVVGVTGGVTGFFPLSPPASGLVLQVILLPAEFV